MALKCNLNYKGIVLPEAYINVHSYNHTKIPKAENEIVVNFKIYSSKQHYDNLSQQDKIMESLEDIQITVAATDDYLLKAYEVLKSNPYFANASP